MQCPTINCNNELVTISGDDFLSLRQESDRNAEEKPSLQCPGCQSLFTATERIDSALKKGFSRCFGTDPPSAEEIIALKWNSLSKPPEHLNGAPNDELDYDRWLQLAVVQRKVNVHDYRHRRSCFKGMFKLKNIL